MKQYEEPRQSGWDDPSCDEPNEESGTRCEVCDKYFDYVPQDWDGICMSCAIEWEAGRQLA